MQPRNVMHAHAHGLVEREMFMINSAHVTAQNVLPQNVLRTNHIPNLLNATHSTLERGYCSWTQQKRPTCVRYKPYIAPFVLTDCETQSKLWPLLSSQDPTKTMHFHLHPSCQSFPRHKNRNRTFPRKFCRNFLQKILKKSTTNERMDRRRAEANSRPRQ